MVIRRIRDHVSAHNWFAVGIDVATVVVGVAWVAGSPTVAVIGVIPAGAKVT